MLYAGVCGPMEVESLSKKLYNVDFKDDFSGFRMIHFIRQKSEVLINLKFYAQNLKIVFPRKLKNFTVTAVRSLIMIVWLCI